MPTPFAASSATCHHDNDRDSISTCGSRFSAAHIRSTNCQGAIATLIRVVGIPGIAFWHDSAPPTVTQTHGAEAPGILLWHSFGCSS
eukprot:2420154-Pyramimonas_sp.AAC.1